jgi:hypothetical protein
MIRMGLRLTLHSGREAVVRLVVTTVAVAAGVALLLGVLAEFHAFQSSSSKACWSCTTGSAPPSALPTHGDLWNNSVDYYQGQTLARLDVAPLGPGAPVPPGISRLPGPGQYYASPALAALLRTVPADQLGHRFPGRLIGTIGDAALTGPGELAVYVGYSPTTLEDIAGTQWISSIGTAPAAAVFTPFFRYAFGFGALAVLFPVLVLIGTATRLAAARREQRFAALRLIGATPRDVRVIASVEAAVTALAGVIAGIAIFLAVRPAVADTAPIGTRYFSYEVTPTIWGYLAMVIAVPAASAFAALVSMRRLQISPLGAARRTTPPRPSIWRLTVLVLGAAAYIYGLASTNHDGIGGATYPGVLLTMIGLVIAGPWFTIVAAWLISRSARGPSALLATRRLTDNPKTASRAVSGLVLAIFLGTMVGVMLPAADSLDKTPNSSALANVLVDQAGGNTQAGQQLLAQLHTIPGTTVYPFYSWFDPSRVAIGPGDGKPGKGSAGGAPGGNFQPPQYPVAVSCAAMRGLQVLGQCRTGMTAVQVDDNNLFDDNPHYQTKAFVSSANPAYTKALASLPLQAVLVRVNNPATLERVRTFLATHTPPATASAQGQAPTPPRTFGETSAIRSARALTAERIIYAAVALTLVVAGCSLAVAVGGGLVERKRPFTLLRVSGTPVGTLSKVVLMEAGLPLAAATLVAGLIAYATSVLAVARLAPAHTPISQLGAGYYELMGAGLAAAVLIICATLPLMRRMTAPATIRFE